MATSLHVLPFTNLRTCSSLSCQLSLPKPTNLFLNPSTRVTSLSTLNFLSSSVTTPHGKFSCQSQPSQKDNEGEKEVEEKGEIKRKGEGEGEGEEARISGEGAALSGNDLYEKLYDQVYGQEEYKEIRTEETEKMMEGFRAAVKRVEEAEAAMRDLERMEREERERRKVEEKEALEDVLSSEEEVFLAREELRAASVALVEARAGSKKPSDLFDGKKWNTEGVDESKERVESGKAAAISGFSGILVGLPFIFVSFENPFGLNSLISVGVILTTCVLFGVTYRYVIRRDLGNNELKSGAVGAFALVRGLAQIDTTQAIYKFPNEGVEEFFRACLNAGESVIILTFSALALEYCLREGILEPFPSQKESR